MQELERQCTGKPRFEKRIKEEQVIALRAIQGHTCCIPDLKSMGWLEVTSAQVPFVYHNTYRACMHSIIKHGLVPGGLVASGGRSENVFSGASPWHVPDELSNIPRYPFDFDTVLIFSTEKAESANARCWLTDGTAVLSRDIINPEALIEVRDRKTGDMIWRSTTCYYDKMRNALTDKLPISVKPQATTQDSDIWSAKPHDPAPAQRGKTTNADREQANRETGALPTTETSWQNTQLPTTFGSNNKPIPKPAVRAPPDGLPAWMTVVAPTIPRLPTALVTGQIPPVVGYHDGCPRHKLIVATCGDCRKICADRDMMADAIAAAAFPNTLPSSDGTKNPHKSQMTDKPGVDQKNETRGQKEERIALELAMAESEIPENHSNSSTHKQPPMQYRARRLLQKAQLQTQMESRRPEQLVQTQVGVTQKISRTHWVWTTVRKLPTKKAGGTTVSTKTCCNVNRRKRKC